MFRCPTLTLDPKNLSRDTMSMGRWVARVAHGLPPVGHPSQRISKCYKIYVLAKVVRDAMLAWPHRGGSASSQVQLKAIVKSH